jgi:hypothetical protein
MNLGLAMRVLWRTTINNKNRFNQSRHQKIFVMLGIIHITEKMNTAQDVFVEKEEILTKNPLDKPRIFGKIKAWMI